MPAVVVAPAEIDLLSVGPLRDELRASILERRGETTWIDLSAVTFLDSVGLGVLVGSRKYARGWGGDLYLVAPSPLVMKVLRVTALDRMLPIDLEASVRAVTRVA